MDPLSVSSGGRGRAQASDYKEFSARGKGEAGLPGIVDKAGHVIISLTVRRICRHVNILHNRRSYDV